MEGDDATGQVEPVDLAPTGLDHAQSQASLIGPGPDRLGEVDVRLGVGGDPLGDARQGLHQVVGVDRLERSPGGGAELAHHDATAAASDAQQLAETLDGVVDVAQPERDRDRVERVVAERQGHAIAGHEGEVATGFLADCEHAEGEVAGHDGGSGVGERLARRAGAGREVEHRHHSAPPAAVLPEGQDVVGQVVALRDVVEHPRDVMGLLVQSCSCHRITVPRVPLLP